VSTLRDELGCEVERLQYNFRSHAGVLSLPSGQCCDMDGCIKLFSGIDPEVVLIETFSGDKQDTTYSKFGPNWMATP
jgi:hypothetical protein